MTLEPIAQTNDVLGEVPIWCERRKRLFWSDVRSCHLRIFDPEAGSIESVVT